MTFSLDTKSDSEEPNSNVGECRGARAALRAAIRELANECVGEDLDASLSSWKALALARWSLLDQFEIDGTRYIVARESPPVSAAFSKLTPTENCVVRYILQGYSTKEIAYALGIKDGTVRVLIMRAARRCGVADRRGLMKLAGELTVVPEAP